MKMYTTMNELQENRMTLLRTWFPDKSIPDRTVRLRRLEDTIRFQSKVTEPELEFDVSFQIPCDTITSSSSCYQDNKQLFLVR